MDLFVLLYLDLFPSFVYPDLHLNNFSFAFLLELLGLLVLLLPLLALLLVELHFLAQLFNFVLETPLRLNYGSL